MSPELARKAEPQWRAGAWARIVFTSEGPPRKPSRQEAVKRDPFLIRPKGCLTSSFKSAHSLRKRQT